MNNLNFYLGEIRDNISEEVYEEIKNCKTIDEVSQLYFKYETPELDWLLMILMRDSGRILVNHEYIFMN